MYNQDTPLVTLPGAFSPLPPSSPTALGSLGSNNSTSRRFSYPNSPVHMSSVKSNGPSSNQQAKNNVPLLTTEPTSNIAAVVAAAAHVLNASAQHLQISKHLQQLRLHHGGSGNENIAPSQEGIPPTIISNNSSVLPSSSSTTNTCTTTKVTGRNNSIPSISAAFHSSSSVGSNSSSIFSTGLGSSFRERAAAAKNRWKAKGSITQGHVPQRQLPAASLGKALHTSLAHSHSFDDAFENGKGVSGSSQLLNRRNTHHR